MSDNKEVHLADVPADTPVHSSNRLLKGGDVELHVLEVLGTTLELNPFLDPKVRAYYAEVYEESKYECRERFDPDFTWTAEEEKALVRKLDWRVCLLACFMFVALQIDRGNLGQATSDNLLKDIGITRDQYNNGNTIFYCTFLFAELPLQLILKRLGPDRWIPIQMTLWSIVAMSQAAMKNAAGFYITRALIGLLEGGFIPDVVLWLSYFYTSKELPMRLSWFWTSLSLTQITTSFLAVGLLKLRGRGGMAGWAWLFLIEGLITLLIGLSLFFLMVPLAVQTKAPWRPKGWFTEHEEKIVVNRVLRDDPSKGDMHNREAITPKLLWQGIKDYDLWPVYFIGLIAYAPTSVLTAYLLLTLRGLGFSITDTNLLNIPFQVLHIALLFVFTWGSERINLRALYSLVQPFYTFPLLCVLAFWSGLMTAKWPTFILTTLILGNPYLHAMCVLWCSTNSNSIKTRTISASLYNMFVQASLIISSQIYRAWDAPVYRVGNGVLVGYAGLLIPTLIATHFYYKWRNSQKAKVWNAMLEDEQDQYRRSNKTTGNKRLDFRFIY